MGMQCNVSGAGKIVILAFTLVTVLAACKSSSSGIDPDGVDPIVDDQLITDHEEFNTLRYAYGLADPEFVGKSFDVIISLRRTFFQETFPSATRCTIDKCTEEGIFRASIAVCDGENEEAINYSLGLDGGRLEFNHCSLNASGEIFDGTITYRFLDGDADPMEIIFDDFSLTSGGVEKSINGKIFSSVSEVDYVKSSDSLTITVGDDHFVVSDYQASISVDGGRYSQTVSMTAGDETRGVFVVTTSKELTGDVTSGDMGSPDEGMLLFKRGTQEMSIELAPGGDLDKVFLTINGVNQTLTKTEFDAFRLFSLIY